MARRSWALLLAVGVGCSGKIGDTEPLPGAPSNPNDPSDPNDPNMPIDPVPPAPLVCPEPERQPLRRLTHREYENTIADLFPAFTASLRLVADPYAGYYDTNLSGLAVSGNLVLDYHENARAISAVARDEIDQVVDCDRSLGRVCLEEYLATIGRRVLRRPLDQEELADYSSLYAAGPTAGDFDASAQLAVQAMLESSEFLYRPELGVGTPDPILAPFERASRLSYFLWASAPDDLLLDAAELGRLETDAQISTEVDRMLADDRARRGVLRFADQWLKTGALANAGKDASERFDVVRPKLIESLDRFVWSVFAKNGTMEELLTSNKVFVDEDLAGVFGVAAPAPGQWAEVDADPAQRSGIVTHPAFLAGHGYPGYPSPVLRGVYVLERFLCTPPQPPPQGITQSPPPATDNGRPLSNREGYERVTLLAGETCARCHTTINPLGFAFEGYDTMGRFRTADAGGPIDASGTSSGFTFRDGVDLAHQLASSTQVARCVTQHWIEYAVADNALADDVCFRRDVFEAFEASGRKLPALVEAIALHPKFARPQILEE
jgi:hypothetical protein